MKDSVKIWNIRVLVVSLTLFILGLVTFNLNLSTQFTYIISLLAFVVCLIVCLCVRQVKNNVDVIETPIIIQTVNGCEIQYDVKGVRLEDIERCLDYLENWKREHNFEFLSHRTTGLIVEFKDILKQEPFVLEIPDYLVEEPGQDIVREYAGLFSYYTDSGQRHYKIDDVQLGNLNFGIMDDINKYANKKCHVWVLNYDEIVGIELIGG